MADRYNVDDILEEIKRKKSGAGSMISSGRAAQEDDFAPVYSRYDDDYEEDRYDGRYTRSREVEEEYEEPRRTARPPREEQYDRYDEPRYRREESRRYADERPERARPVQGEYEDPYDRRRSGYSSRDYEDRPRRPVREEFYEERRPRTEYDEPRRVSRGADRYDYDRDYDRYDNYDRRPPEREAVGSYREDYDRYDEPPVRRREEYDDRPRREERFDTARFRRSQREEDVPEEETGPRRSGSARRYAGPEEEAYTGRSRRLREEYEDRPARDPDYEPRRSAPPEDSDDLSILRERIADAEPRRSRFEELEREEHTAAPEPEQPAVTGGTIITSREDILKNFGRSGRTASFTRSFDAARAERRTDMNERSTEESSQADDYTATQMNIDLYAMDEEGNSRAEEERRTLRRKQKEARGEPVPEDDDAYDDGDVDDFNTPRDANKVYKTIRTSKKRLTLRFVLTLVLFGVLSYLTVSLTNINLPLLTFMLPEKNMQAFMGVNLGLMVLAMLINISTVVGGLKALFTLRPSSDGPIAIAGVVALIQGIVLILNPDAVTGAGVHYYFAVTVLGLVFNLLGKLFMINRIDRNFRLLAEGGYQRHAFNIINDRNLARELTRNQDLDPPVVGYSQPADFLTNFMHFSSTEDYGENITRITTPIFFGFSVVISGATQVLYGDVFMSLTVFSAMTLICAPLTSSIVGNLPLRRMNKALCEDGSMVAGYTALDRFDDINCFVIKDSELFGPQSITLHGIKTFDQKRIDEAMVDAASIVCKSDCVLSYIFTQMIGGNEKILKKADSIVYEDSMGISAWVDGKRVLIGNRDLMLGHNIEIPSKDYEKKFVRDGREVLYLANSGELTAIFVLSYAADPDIADQLGVLADRGIGISVYTTDSNITPQKIAEVFDFPEDMVEIVPYKLHSQCDRLMEHRDRAKAEIVYNGSLASKVRTLSGIIAAKTSIVLGTILQCVGVTIGYALLTYFALTNAIGSVNFTLLIAYQCFWALVVMLLPNLRRY